MKRVIHKSATTSFQEQQIKFLALLSISPLQVPSRFLQALVPGPFFYNNLSASEMLISIYPSFLCSYYFLIPIRLPSRPLNCLGNSWKQQSTGKVIPTLSTCSSCSGLYQPMQVMLSYYSLQIKHAQSLGTARTMCLVQHAHCKRNL